MTDTVEALDGDPDWPVLRDSIGKDPSLANERVVTSRHMEPRWCDELLVAVDGVELSVPDPSSVS